jgi:endonuclease/exonuclease/phosphatase family metal-dependent hydrolase
MQVPDALQAAGDRAGTAPLVVMTWNIKGDRAGRRAGHLDRLAETIGRFEPDFVGLQEVHRETIHGGGVDQAAILAGLTGMESVFGESRRPAGGGSYGNALLSRHPTTQFSVRPLPGIGERRSLLEVRAEVAGRALDLFVTHLTAFWPFGRKQRREQAEAVAAIVRKSSRPFILLGDFNTPPRGSELAAFRGGELVTTCFPAAPATHGLTRQCLDYIFVHPSWTVEHAAVVRAGPSDHWPLVTHLGWPE